MKKIVIAIMVLSLVLSLAAPAYCDGPFKKLGRGIFNFITSPLEIPNRFNETRKRSGYGIALTYGIIEGVVMTGFRAAMGFYEVLTFPIPIPAKYEPILNDPEYFFNFGKKDKE